ncbi:MAG: PIN domain-containing protein [Armatimonadota bacterium]
MRIVDSVGWIAYFMGDPLADSYRQYIRNQSEVVTPCIIAYEVYKKVASQIGRRAAAMAVAQLGKTQLIPFDFALANSAARYSLRYKLPMADAIIYATAVSTHATVVTSDAHFRNLPGVEFIPR